MRLFIPLFALSTFLSLGGCDAPVEPQTPNEECCDCLADNSSVTVEIGYDLPDGGTFVEEIKEPCQPSFGQCMEDFEDNEISGTAECLLVDCGEACDHLEIEWPQN